MLVFRDFFKTRSDQNIYQNVPNCTKFSKIFNDAYASKHMPLNLLAYTCDYNN